MESGQHGLNFLSFIAQQFDVACLIPGFTEEVLMGSGSQGGVFAGWGLQLKPRIFFPQFLHPNIINVII